MESAAVVFQFLLLTACSLIVCVAEVTDETTEDATSTNDQYAKKHEGFNRRYEMVPDSEGQMYMVDFNVYQPPPGPSFEAQLDVKFFLSTRKSKKEEIERSLESISGSSFDKTLPTRITIHGWNANANDTDVLINAYLEKGDFNCIAVDWSRGASAKDYVVSRNRIDDTAMHVADLIDFLAEEKFLKLDDLHIVGHSLGAHVAGMTGKFVTQGDVGAIYGLDPAGPLFFCEEPEDRLSSTDATYVEVLHTNGYGLGYGGPLGNVDYYANFGRKQPGCGDVVLCSHLRALSLFAESISSRNFIATRCNSAREIGKDSCTAYWPGQQSIMTSEPANYNLEGYFYFETNWLPPYAKT